MDEELESEAPQGGQGMEGQMMKYLALSAMGEIFLLLGRDFRVPRHLGIPFRFLEDQGQPGMS